MPTTAEVVPEEFQPYVSKSGDRYVASLENKGLKAIPQWLRPLAERERLTTLHLRGNRLTAIPDWLGDLTALTTLDLSDNRLTTVPKSLGNLTRLTTLDLSDNRLTTVPKSLGNLTALTALYLGRNPHMKAISAVLVPARAAVPSVSDTAQAPVAVSTVDASGNRLTAVPKSLGNLTALTHLDLSGNRLTEVPESLGNLTALTHLDLSDNHLSVLPQQLADLRTDGLDLRLEGNERDVTFGSLSSVWPGELLDRMWMRFRSLFLPSVSLAAVLAVIDISDPPAELLQLYTWERDRLLTLAKGAAGAAITVLAGLIAAAVDGKVAANGIILSIVAALVAALLFWGGFLLAELRRLAEEYATALTLKK